MKVTAGWITGFFFALSSSTLHAVAYQMFRRVHNNIALQVDSESSAEEAANATRRTSYVWKPFWLLGFSCMVVGAFSDILALGYAPAALVAPMIGSLTLICNMCLNPIISGEAVSRRTIGITLLICCSTVITILFSPRGDHNEGHDIGIELKDIYLSSNFALFSMAAAVLLLSLWRITIRYQDTPTIYSVAVPAISGTLGALNKTLAKGMAIGLKFTFRGDGCFCTEWLWYIVFFTVWISLYGHLQWLNRGLAAFSPLHVIPINATCSILVTTISGLVVFRESSQFHDTASLIMFTLGMLMLVSGVIAITWNKEVPLLSPSSHSRKRSLSMNRVITQYLGVLSHSPDSDVKDMDLEIVSQELSMPETFSDPSLDAFSYSGELGDDEM